MCLLWSCLHSSFTFGEYSHYRPNLFEFLFDLCFLSAFKSGVFLDEVIELPRLFLRCFKLLTIVLIHIPICFQSFPFFSCHSVLATSVTSLAVRDLYNFSSNCRWVSPILRRFVGLSGGDVSVDTADAALDVLRVAYAEIRSISQTFTEIEIKKKIC